MLSQVHSASMEWLFFTDKDFFKKRGLQHSKVVLFQDLAKKNFEKICLKKKCFFSSIYPTIKSLQKKLMKLKQSVKYTAPLVSALLDGVERRFSFLGGSVQSCKDYVLTTCSMPMSRNKIFPDSRKEAATIMFDEEAKRMRTSDPDDNKSNDLSGDGSYEFLEYESDLSESNYS